MKQPENFKKIDEAKTTTTSGYLYKFNIDGVTKDTTLWAFRQPDETKYSLAIIFDWKMNRYEIRRAKTGDGTNWDKTLHKGLINRENILTMNGFIVWATMLLDYYEKYYN